MTTDKGMALSQSQAMLHCENKAQLYTFHMMLGKRIKAARERLRPKCRQADLAEPFKITAQSVSQWERDETVPELDKLPQLARLLQVPLTWLLEGSGAPPDIDSQARLEGLTATQRDALSALLDTLYSDRDRVA